MSHSIDRIAELRTRIVRIVRESTGMHERLAVPIAEAICGELQACYGGSPVYIPSLDKHRRNRAIQDAWKVGTPIDVLCQQYRISRRTAYRLIGPGG